MRQERIMELLIEAADPACSNERLMEILVKLKSHVYKNNILGLLLINTFQDCVKQSQELLPSLFPLCAVLCGNRDKDRLFADVNWSLIKNGSNSMTTDDIIRLVGIQ